MKLPGPGALWMSQNFRFVRPAFLGDKISLSVEITALSESARTVTLDCRAINQLGEEIMNGIGEVMLLENKAEEANPDAPQSRVAIVTGASRGIGAAIARRLAADGFSIALTYNRSRSEAEAISAEIEQAACFECDVTDPVAMAALPRDVARRLGAPGVIVLNASDRDLYGDAADGNFERFRRHLSGQLEGSHALVSATIGDMVENGGGNIVALGTTYAHGAPPAGMAPYVVAKSALSAYIRCLAVEYGPMGIRSNMVAPGMTETALLSGMSDRARKVAAAQNPMRRLAMPNDVAGAVAYLVSQDAQYINGQTLVVSGGGLML
jgi:3-oxoacyl-[acyl-carrier protein] reductase